MFLFFTYKIALSQISGNLNCLQTKSFAYMRYIHFSLVSTDFKNGGGKSCKDGLSSFPHVNLNKCMYEIKFSTLWLHNLSNEFHQ